MSDRYIIAGDKPDDEQVFNLLRNVSRHDACQHQWSWNEFQLHPMPHDRRGVAEQFRCLDCGASQVIEWRPSVIGTPWC